ncbi:MAG TPA: hypothetical protein VF519_11950 [Mycobacteriales bacterium]|jgi:hypothetical protein
MRRLFIAAVIAAAAGSVGSAAPASAICRPFIGPICLPACPLPDPNDPLPYTCPL